MFFSISMCTIAQRPVNKLGDTDFRKAHYVAAGADLISGIALLAIGMLALQSGFLPTHLAYASIGAGAAYSFGLFCAIGLIVKELIAPNSHLFKSDNQLDLQRFKSKI